MFLNAHTHTLTNTQKVNRKTAMQRHSAKDLHDILKFIAF